MEGFLLMGTNSSKATCGIIVAFQRDFDGFKVFLDSQVLNVVQAICLRPELSVNGIDANIWQVVLNGEV